MIDRVVVLLLAACAIFGALLFIELDSADTAEPAVMAAPAQVETRPAPRRQSPRGDELVATALGRPLFSATRRPPEGAKTDRPADPELPNLRLTGIVIEPERHLAIFAVPGAKPFVRAEGETVNEWRLDSVAPHEVSLSGPNGITKLEPKTDPNLVRPAAQAVAPPNANPMPIPTPMPAAASASRPPAPLAATAQPKPPPPVRVPGAPPGLIRGLNPQRPQP
jgi:general secretion pathway protein N